MWFVAQRGFARSDLRSALSHPLENLRRWQRFWALVIPAFPPGIPACVVLVKPGNQTTQAGMPVLQELLAEHTEYVIVFTTRLPLR